MEMNRKKSNTESCTKSLQLSQEFQWNIPLTEKISDLSFPFIETQQERVRYEKEKFQQTWFLQNVREYNKSRDGSTRYAA